MQPSIENLYQGAKSEKPENVRAAIETMQRVKERGEDRLFMSSYQYHPLDNRPEGGACTEQQATECGTVCCFAGWVALSPHFHEIGGLAARGGYPILPEFPSMSAPQVMAHYLGITTRHAELLTCTYFSTSAEMNFYGVEYIEEITPDHVIKKLQELL